MKYFFAILSLLCLSIGCVAQYKLKGTVLSKQDSVPLTGITLGIPNSQFKTMTDNSGGFSLTVSQNSFTLRASATGYETIEQEVTIPLSSPLIIYLSEQSEMLNEVIISTGYQQLSKERAVGAFSHIDNQLFNQQVGTDVISRLEAIGNGVSVNRNSVAPKLMVRGLSTINGPAEPLIILDNFPYEGDLSNINPNDVADITILKDAAAASIWGTRAGNGVVVITTKKGRLNEPLTIDFNANASVGFKPDLSYIQWINSADFIELEKLLFDNGYYNSDISSRNRPVLSPVVELLAQRSEAPLGTVSTIDAQIEQLKQRDTREDFKNHLYGNGVNQQYFLRLSGGAKKMAWNTSAGYDRNRGNLGENYHRLNLRFTSQTEITEYLSLTAGLSMTQTNNQEGRPAWNDITTGTKQLYPYAALMDKQGQALAIPKEFRQAYLDTAGGGQLLDWRYRPLADYRHTDVASNAQHIITHAAVRFRPIDALSFDLNYQFERQYSENNANFQVDSYFVRDLINTFTQIDRNTGEITRHVPLGGIKDSKSSILNTHNIRAQLNFDKSTENHAVSVILGGEVRQTHSSGSGHRLYGYEDDILVFGTVDFVSQIPKFVSGFPSRIPLGVSLTDLTNRFVSVYSNASYTFKDRYTLYASLRSDASNLYGVRTNDKWRPLWSVGSSWDVLAEEMFPWRKGMARLKVRATYGVSGNADPSRTAVTTMSYGSLSPYTNSPYATFRTYANAELRWEVVRTLNLGVDFATMGNRVYGSVEFYRKWADDLFGFAPTDITMGVGSAIIKNVASMRAGGMDIDLNAKIIDRDFRWATNLNLNFYTDRVTDYMLATSQGSNYVSNRGSIVTGLKGKPVYSLLSYRWAGLDPETGDPQGFFRGEVSSDYNSLTGSSVVIDDLVFHGSALPKWMGSFGNTFGYKDLSVTFRFLYKFGHYFRKTTLNYGNLFSRWQMHADYANRWVAPGDEQFTDVPSMIYPNSAKRDNFYNGSTVNVLRGDFIRLQYINIDYRLKGARNPYLKNVSVYGTAENLGILWRKNSQGIDPEYIGNNSIPPAATIALGIRASF